MNVTIEITEQTYKRLQRYAIPFEDNPDSLIQRLLDHFERASSGDISVTPRNGLPQIKKKHRQADPDLKLILDRVSRQRGIRVQIDYNEIKAESLSDLYKKVMIYLEANGCLDQLKTKLPWSTSRQRYLIALAPAHPAGNDFVVPVEHKGYFMEAHKDYKTGLKHLRELLKECGSTLTVLE